MNNQNKPTICPVEKAGGLDNAFRRLLQNPFKILKPYIHEGMVVLDLGCGPGFFSTEMAKMVMNSGKIIAADLQQGMLDKVQQKIVNTNLSTRIVTHLVKGDKIGLTQKVDFVLAFYMMHEVPDQEKLLSELKEILKPGGKLYIIEPKFHVNKKAFQAMIESTQKIGFEILEQPKVFFSRAVVLTAKA